jgi:hypothetical protein
VSGSLTAGELLTGRRLAKERRAGGEHYVTGQQEARLLEEPPTPGHSAGAALSYVDMVGHAVLVLCGKRERDGEWEPLAVRRAGIVVTEEARPPNAVGFTLSEKMRSALQEAS